jgi:hypothetical protein
MSEITVTDYETVEKERTVTVCDSCGFEMENTVEMAVNPRSAVTEQWDVLQTYDDQHKARSAVQMRNKTQRTIKTHRKKWGVGRMEKEREAKADVSLDVCEGCFEATFDHAMPEDTDTIEFTSDGIEAVSTTEALVDWEKVRVITICWILLCIILTAANILVL